MITRLHALLMGLALLLPLPVAATDGVDEGLLWRVEAEGTEAPSYVFGTAHTNDSQVLELPEPVDEAFRSAEHYRFELDFNAIDMASAQQYMVYSSGRRLSDVLPKKLWQRALDAATSLGIPERGVERLKPWALATTLAAPVQDMTQTLDHQLYTRAKERSGSVEGLETLEEQLTIFGDMDESLQVELLRTTLDQHEAGRIEALQEELTEAYLARDLAAMMELAEEHPGLPGDDDADALMERLLDERNHTMVERMADALDAGGAFVAVGALHLPGENGLVRLLEERGYQVSPVY